MTKRPSTGLPCVHAARQRGVATLVVVGVLFLILSMVAAYTNRNLIFEQRTLGNQYRATQAFEAAEAGVEWALAMLNGGRITTACTPGADTTLSSFRQRYLSIDAATGAVQPQPNVAAGSWASCVHDGTNWVCSCPVTGSPSLSVPEGTGVFPAFRVRFLALPDPAARPGAVRLQVNGCTRLVADCLDFPATGVAGEGRASIEALIALKSALPSPPVAAVTVRDDFDLEGQAFGAFNPSPGSSGIAVMAGGTLANKASLRFGSTPGTPAIAAELVREGDTALGNPHIPSGERLFGAVFAASPANYRDQPATLLLDCTTTACDADRLRAVAGRHPGRILWAEGDVSLNGGADLGAPDNPVVLVVEGDLAIDNFTVHGLVYGRADPEWTVTGSNSRLRGALIAENDLAGGASFDVVHDAGILNHLRWRHGSFVRVPGGWRDF
jgi:hypothetical protein